MLLYLRQYLTLELAVAFRSLSLPLSVLVLCGWECLAHLSSERDRAHTRHFSPLANEWGQIHTNLKHFTLLYRIFFQTFSSSSCCIVSLHSHDFKGWGPIFHQKSQFLDPFLTPENWPFGAICQRLTGPGASLWLWPSDVQFELLGMPRSSEGCSSFFHFSPKGRGPTKIWSDFLKV